MIWSMVLSPMVRTNAILLRIGSTAAVLSVMIRERCCGICWSRTQTSKIIELYEENEEYKSHPEEFEEQREEYEMEPGDTFDFEDELQYWLDDWKPSKLSMAEEVEAIRDYVEALRKFKGE